MADLLGGHRESKRYTILRVAVHTVCVDLLHQSGHGIGPGLVWLASTLIPHHHGEEHAHAVAMEFGDHLTHALDATRHGFDHLQLIAIIDSHVWIGCPYQHRVNAAV